MKKHTILLAVALLTAGTLATGCSSDDAAVGNPIQQTAATGEMAFSATIAPKSNSTRSVDADGVTTWVVDEKIAVYYEKEGGGYDKATATVGTPNADGSAPITATLTGAKNGGEVKFVYPATLANATGDDINMNRLLNYQHGTIDDISANFDAATATATLATNGITYGTTATVTFTNRVLIGKFTPQLNGTAIDEITTLTVSDGTNTYTVAPSSGTFGTTGIYVAMLPVSDKKVKIAATTASQNYLYPGKSISLEVGKLYTNLAVAMTKGVDLSMLSANCTLHDGEMLTGKLNGETQKVKVQIAAGATVTLDGVTIDGKHYDDTDFPGAGINCLGDATIIVKGENTVKNFNRDYPAILAAHNATEGGTEYTLTIKGGSTDKLTATGDGSCAAIGGGYGIACGNIEIEGCIITANGGNSSAAIGGGQSASCGNITISGATVNATGGGGAGIGSGNVGGSGSASCGDITISGNANVTATGSRNAAGIGSGASNGSNGSNACGNITISGACTVIATGGYHGAGIGTGSSATCRNIEITGGTVTAQGGDWAAGIGCGKGAYDGKSECGAITIKTIEGHKDDFTSVTAIRGQYAWRPIGHISEDSDWNTCGTITFGNTTVYTANSPIANFIGGISGLNFSQTTTVPTGEDNNDGRYDDNTWVLTPPQWW